MRAGRRQPDHRILFRDLRLRMILALLCLPGAGCAPPALHRAAGLRNATEVEQILEGGADVDAQDRKGRTALMVAIDRGPQDVELDEVPTAVRVLLDAGADVNSRQHGSGMTALRYAVKKAYPGVVRELLRRGATAGVDDLLFAHQWLERRRASYQEHHDWFVSRFGNAEFRPMWSLRRRIHRAERVVAHLPEHLDRYDWDQRDGPIADSPDTTSIHFSKG